MKKFFLLRAVSMLCGAWYLGFNFAPQADAARIGSTKIIVMTGDPAPDGDGVFGDVGMPSLNSQGAIAFSATVAKKTDPTNYTHAIFRCDGDVITQIVSQGDNVPNGNGVFERIDAPELNDAGEVLFNSWLLDTNDGIHDNEGYFRGDGLTISEIVRQGDIAPGNIGEFRYLRGLDYNNLGETVFMAKIWLSPDIPGGSVGIYRGDGDQITETVRILGESPSGDGVVTTLGHPKLNDLGKIALSITTADAYGGPNERTVAYIYDYGEWSEVMGSGQISPDGDGVFNSIKVAAFNNSGEVFVEAALTSTGGGAKDYRGLFRTENEAVIQVFREGDASPDGNGNIVRILHYSVSGSTCAAFVGEMVDTANGRYDDTGVFRGDGAAFLLVAREGDAAPDGNGVMNTFLQPLINSRGAVAFFAYLSGTSGGFHDDNGVFYFDENRGIIQVAREGDAFLGSTIERLRASAAWGPEIDFNDNGDIAYQYWLTDGRSGIAVWSIPEPSGIVLSAFFMVAIAGRAAMRAIRPAR